MYSTVPAFNSWTLYFHEISFLTKSWKKSRADVLVLHWYNEQFTCETHLLCRMQVFEGAVVHWSVAFVVGNNLSHWQATKDILKTFGIIKVCFIIHWIRQRLRNNNFSSRHRIVYLLSMFTKCNERWHRPEYFSHRELPIRFVLSWCWSLLIHS